MKTIKILALGLLASLMMLGGCKRTPVEPEPNIIEPIEVELVSIAVSGEFKTNYVVGEEFDSTGIVVTASYSDESTSDVTEETVFSGFDSSIAGTNVVIATYEDKIAEINLTIMPTVESAAADIGTLLGRSLSNKGSYYGITLNFSQNDVDYSNTQASEEVLYPVIYTLVTRYMPEYFELVGAKYFTSEEDFWEDESGDTAYYAYLKAGEVGVDLISYCYSGYLLGQIAVYSIA